MIDLKHGTTFGDVLLPGVLAVVQAKMGDDAEKFLARRIQNCHDHDDNFRLIEFNNDGTINRDAGEYSGYMTVYGILDKCQEVALKASNLYEAYSKEPLCKYNIANLFCCLLAGWATELSAVNRDGRTWLSQ